MHAKEIMLCSICNVASGNCSEDCGFCAQSIRHNAKIEKYKLKDEAQIVHEAKRAKALGALGFCLVTSGRECDDKKLEHICRAAFEINAQIEGLHLIACLGIASLEQLKELKKHGIASYNHNLETSKSFYPKACGSMDWQERYDTAARVRDADLMLCCGGIFGLGESWDERMEFLKSLSSLKPHSVPINFFVPNEALSIKEGVIDRSEALECIKMSRDVLKDSLLMIAGGREVVFGDEQREIFEYGVDAVVLGDYLTTSGEEPNSDISRIKSYGYGLAIKCFYNMSMCTAD